jgi:uncharacterized protein YbjT (DUF2867 family)
MKTLIAVTGATGAQGGALAHLLLDRGLPVRGLTRNPDHAEELRARGAEITFADFDDPASLRAALSGCRALFLMSTPFGTSVETEVQQGKTTVDAAVHAGVEHVVFSSVAHADRATGVPHFDSKYEIERHLAASPLTWTVLGPAKFMDNYASARSAGLLRQGLLALPMSADRPVALVCCADIAGMAALALAEPDRFAGVRVDIAGEEATPAAQAEAFSAELGHPVVFQQVPDERARSYGDDLAAMFRYFDKVGLDVDTEALRRNYPEVGWHTFAEWLAGREWLS